MYIADIVNDEPDEAAVGVQTDIAHPWAVEEPLGDPVIEAFPLDLYGDDPIAVRVILDLRIFYGNIIQIVL